MPSRVLQTYFHPLRLVQIVNILNITPVATGATNTEIRVLRVEECKKKKEKRSQFGNRRVPWADGPSDGFIVAVHNPLYPDSYGSGHLRINRFHIISANQNI